MASHVDLNTHELGRKENGEVSTDSKVELLIQSFFFFLQHHSIFPLQTIYLHTFLDSSRSKLANDHVILETPLQPKSYSFL